MNAKISLYHVGQKNAPYYFCNNFVEPCSILISFGTYILQQFPIEDVFYTLYKVENRKPA